MQFKALNKHESAHVFFNFEGNCLGIQFKNHRPQPNMIGGEIFGFPGIEYHYDQCGVLVAIRAWAPFDGSRSEAWMSQARRVFGTVFETMQEYMKDDDFVVDHLMDNEQDGFVVEMMVTVDDDMSAALIEARNELVKQQIAS